VLGYTIAAELGGIGRFRTSAKLVSYTGLCPRVRQSGEVDRRGRLSKRGPPYLRRALIEAAHNAIRYDAGYRELSQRTRARLGRQRSSSPANSPRRSGGCSPATNRLLRQAPGPS
jgi:transposase